MPPKESASLNAPEGDEFDEFDFREFTQQDWDLVTAIEAKAQSAFTEPIVVVQPPSQPAPTAADIASPVMARPALRVARRSLLVAYRQQGSLSVSDLVGPHWCEVKFDYNLRWGGRWDRVAQKPPEVITARGKHIQVKKLTAQKSESTMEAGRAVHKKLEKALQPAQIHIPVTSPEERWGSRILTMLSGLQLLRTLGYCREFPVMGYIDGILILGIIDEIVRKPMPVPSTPSTKGKQKADIPAPDQLSIPKFFQNASPQDLSSAEPGISQPVRTYILHLIDNKTRNNPTVPSPRDRFQSQLQLMLYKRLLSSLIVSTTFASIMTQLSLKMHAPFSQKFLHAKKILCISNDLSKQAHEADCMADLADAWNQAIGELDIGFRVGAEAGLDLEGSGIEDELELVYRERPDASRSQSLNIYKGKRKGSTSPMDTPRDGKRSVTPHSNTGSFTLEVDAALLNVDLDVGSPGPHVPVQYETANSVLITNGIENDDENMALAWAIQESLQPLSTAGTHDKLNGKRDPSLNGEMGGATGIPVEPYPTTVQEPQSRASGSTPTPQSETLATVSTEIIEGQGQDNTHSSLLPAPPVTASPPPTVSHVREAEKNLAPIIGVHKFQYSAQTLNEYLVKVLRFWRGERDAVGVEIEDASRCNHCEFRDGCEWREAKAEEFAKVRAPTPDLADA